MVQSAHVKSELVGGVPVALLTTEKIGEYETGAIETDLAKLAAECRHRFAIDFSQVRLLSSVGIGLLIKLQKLAKAGGGRIVYCCIDPSIIKLLAMTRLDKGMPIYPDRAAAVKALQ